MRKLGNTLIAIGLWIQRVGRWMSASQVERDLVRRLRRVVDSVPVVSKGHMPAEIKMSDWQRATRNITGPED